MAEEQIKNLDATLTCCELDILNHLAMGYTKKKLSLHRTKSIGAIDKEVNLIVQKLQAKNVADAIAIAIQSDLI